MEDVWGSEEDDEYERRMQRREVERNKERFIVEGYREGLEKEDEHDHEIEMGFHGGFPLGVHAGVREGLLHGIARGMLEARNCGWVTLSQDEQASWQALETKLCIRKVPDVPVQACLLPSLKSPSEKAKGICAPSESASSTCSSCSCSSASPNETSCQDLSASTSSSSSSSCPSSSSCCRTLTLSDSEVTIANLRNYKNRCTEQDCRCYTAGEEDVPNALRKVDNGNYNLKDATVRESLDNENSKSTSREKILLGECVELLAKGSIINSQAVFFPDNHSTGHKDVGEGAGVASKVGDDKMVVLVKSLQG